MTLGTATRPARTFIYRRRRVYSGASDVDHLNKRRRSSSRRTMSSSTRHHRQQTVEATVTRPDDQRLPSATTREPTSSHRRSPAHQSVEKQTSFHGRRYRVPMRATKSSLRACRLRWSTLLGEHVMSAGKYTSWTTLQNGCSRSGRRYAISFSRCCHR